ncbi:hypothetical protein SAMN05216275_14153 [Streptosporangium canum]|uniref:MerR HTH family regulatory protein n=1 Tax=Streptosporangium canum TaxID=324952 RepID=A0A1I4DFJ2_9ACTN|nr:hypothetical protein [Streptosporangium canum]SFK92418.1 hypothetical protein SAMN05216275_14153 [Streptosporangium canum]
MTSPEPVTAATAGRRLGKTPATIRKWAERYHAAQLGRQNRAVYYDFGDLATIDACIHRGDPVPATPADRDQLRAGYRNAA